MCGIVGIADHSLSPTIQEEQLRIMSKEIQHRGPDSDGHWISSDHRCGLAFRRLSIIDLSKAGNQPMTTADGRFSIVFNGEIYNHAEIREELIKKGYKYSSKTDTETILYGYVEYGKKIVEKMNGMWAFAIWDNNEKTLFCSRDRIGIKPFYYTKFGNRFIFSSEIKAILKDNAINRELNLYELPNYLNYGLSSCWSTLYKNISKIPAGHNLTVNRDGNIFIERYWSPSKSFKSYTELSSNELQQELLRLLRRSIKDRMMSDVPFGVFLSGGVDSSLNVALMDELMDRPVDTFSVGFEDLEKYNELVYARQIAEKFKTNHHETIISERDSFDILEKLPIIEDEPNADPVCIPLYYLSKLTRSSGTTVIQVGEGSDEQFIGYPWMLREYKFHETYWKSYNALPKLFRRAIYETARPAMKLINQELALEYLRRGTFNEEQYWSGISIFSPTHLSGLFGKEYKYLVSKPYDYALSNILELRNDINNPDFLQTILFLELRQRLAEILLMRVDKITMAHSLEARVPFLDHRIVEFAMSISPQNKLPDGKTTKYLLKKAVESVLPHDIIYRPKQGFAAPVNEWLSNQWFAYAENKLMNSSLVKNGILNKKYINRLLLQHRGGKNHGQHLFSLLMLSIWHENNF